MTRDGGPVSGPAHERFYAIRLHKPANSSVGVALAQLDAPDLAGQRLGQLVDELDDARIRVGRVALADVRRDLLAQLVRRLVAGGEDDERLDDLPAALV